GGGRYFASGDDAFVGDECDVGESTPDVGRDPQSAAHARGPLPAIAIASISIRCAGLASTAAISVERTGSWPFSHLLFMGTRLYSLATVSPGRTMVSIPAPKAAIDLRPSALATLAGLAA